MLKIRVIPCLDVKEGRVVKGVKFVDLARRRRSGRGRRGLRRGGRRRALLPRHHRQPREARHHPRRGRPHGRALLHAAHRRRRGAQRGRRARAARSRRRQGLHQHRGGAGQKPGARRLGEVRRAMHRGRHRRQARRLRRRANALRDLHPWRPRGDRNRGGGLRARGGRRSARARSCSPPWTATARARVSTSN